MSTLSTASDRLNSSQPSGSDSCGAEYSDGAQCSFEDCAFGDPSQSDRDPHWRSDSDCATPRSGHDAPGPTRSAKEPQHAGWESIESGIARLRTSLPRRMDMAQSPGSTGEPGNFRERVGMTESGPVIPFGHGPRRDAISSMMTPHYYDGQEGGGGGAQQHPGGQHGGQHSGQQQHGHGRHRARKHR